MLKTCELGKFWLAASSTATAGAVGTRFRYLDTLRYVLIALALAGLGVVIYARLDDWRTERR